MKFDHFIFPRLPSLCKLDEQALLSTFKMQSVISQQRENTQNSHCQYVRLTLMCQDYAIGSGFHPPNNDQAAITNGIKANLIDRFRDSITRAR